MKILAWPSEDLRECCVLTEWPKQQIDTARNNSLNVNDASHRHFFQLDYEISRLRTEMVIARMSGSNSSQKNVIWNEIICGSLRSFRQ